MKNLARLLLALLGGLVLVTESATEGETTTRLYPIVQGGKWGYIDRAGKVVIAPQFDAAEAFSEGLGAVNLAGKWGFVDASGRLAIPARFDEVRDFSEGLCSVRVGGKWRFVDRSARPRSHVRYDEARSFSDGLAAVRVGRRWGFINREMRMVISPRFDGAWPFTEGLAPARIGKRWGYINRTGSVVIQPQYYWVDNFSEGLAFVEGGLANEGYINAKGEFVIRRRFYDANPFSDGAAAVEQEAGGAFVLIEKDGRQVGDSRFERVGLFSEGLAGAWLGDSYAYVDHLGNSIIKGQFTWGERFSGGLAKVWVQAKQGYIDRAGTFVWGPADPGPSKPVSALRPQASGAEVFEARVVGPASVPAKGVTCIGNPYRRRYPDDTPSVFARTIWDMLLFDGQVYVGCGDLWNNLGPVDIYSFAPREEKFVLEYTAPDEMVSKFYAFDDRLVVPGDDPQESWELGNIYIKERGEWRKVRTLPNGLHCYRLAYLNGDLFAAISTEHMPNLLVSRDWGRSWAPVVYGAVWMRALFEFDGKLRAFGPANLLYTMENDVLFPEEMTPKLQELTRRSPTTYPQWHYTGALAFGDAVIISTSGLDTRLGNQPYPLLYLPPHQTQASVISIFANEKVMDVVARGDTLYALCTRRKRRGFENAIYATTDVRSWWCVAAFATESFPRSFEETGGVFYVGIGCGGVPGGMLSNSSGDILRVVPAGRGVHRARPDCLGQRTTCLRENPRGVDLS